MQFAHPEILYALSALIIPILVHLFQLRRFKIQEFTNLAFLKIIKLQTRRSSTLKKWLVLSLRLLALSCIIMAFAQPYFSNLKTKEIRPELVIFLDNSFSMQAVDSKGMLLERSIQDIITYLDHDLEINIFTNTKTYQNTTINALQNDLLDMDYTQRQLDIKTILSKGKMMFSDQVNNPKFFIVISDFQSTNSPINEVKRDSGYKLILIQKKPLNPENNFIEKLEISALADEYKLDMKANSSTGKNENITLSVYDDQKLIGKSTLKKSNKYSTSIYVPKREIDKGKLILDDNGLSFDDEYYFSIAKQKRISVLAIGKKTNTYLPRIYTKDEFIYNFQNVKQTVYTDIPKQDLIVLDALERIPEALQLSLKSYKESGGHIVIIPSNSSELSSYSPLFNMQDILKTNSLKIEKKITKINFDHPIYTAAFEDKVKNFEFPKATNSYGLNKTANTLLYFQDDTPFLVQHENVFVFASNISSDDSNFIYSPLVVPTFYSIGTSSFKIPKVQYSIGDEHKIDSKRRLGRGVVLRISNKEESFIPLQQKQNSKQQITTKNRPNKAGHYALHHKGDTLQYLSFNYARDESVLQYINIEEIAADSIVESIQNSLDIVKSTVNIKALWKWFVIFALIFLALEMLILKIFK